MEKGSEAIAIERLVSECRRLSLKDSRDLVDRVLPGLERDLMSAPMEPHLHRFHRPWRTLVLTEEEQESLARRGDNHRRREPHAAPGGDRDADS